MAQFIQKSKDSVLATGNFVGLHGDEEVFGNKEFINDIIIRGDLDISGTTRGDTAYFDRIVVANLEGAETDGSSGESYGGINTGPIFVTSVNAVGGVREIIESEYSGAVIKKVKTASDQVDVQLLIERGDAQTYKPQVSYMVSGQDNSSQNILHPDLSTNSNGYSFNTTVRLDSSQPITYLFKNGSRQTYLCLEKDTPPEVLEAKFINRSGTSSFYETSSFSAHDGAKNVQQTEAKNGDGARVYVKSSKPIGQVSISGGAVQSKTLNSPSYIDNGDGTYEVEFNVNISGAGNSVQVKGFSVSVKDITGNPSESYASDNSIVTNNSSPSLSLTFSYPNSYNLINNTTDTIDINVTATDFDFYNFTKSSVLKFVTIPTDINSAPFVLSAENATTFTSGSMTMSLFKASNGRSVSRTTNSIQIQSEGTVPSLNFSPNLFRSSSSGAQYSNVTVSVGEPLQSLTIKSTSDPNVNIGTISKVNDRSFSFQILISDATPRGQFSITFEGTKLIGDVFEKSDTGTVRGFDQRTVRILATQYLPVDIGVDIFNVSKLSVSATPVGGNTFSIPYDPGITGPKQDGTSNLEGAFGIVDGSKVVVDNQVITNAGNILDVDITIEEAL